MASQLFNRMPVYVGHLEVLFKFEATPEIKENENNFTNMKENMKARLKEILQPLLRGFVHNEGKEWETGEREIPFEYNGHHWEQQIFCRIEDVYLFPDYVVDDMRLLYEEFRKREDVDIVRDTLLARITKDNRCLASWYHISGLGPVGNRL